MEKYSFQEVIRQYKRGCVREYGLEGGCPFFPTCNIKHCRKIAFERPEEFEHRVMEWAEAHPEPVYPTWGAWIKWQMGYDIKDRIPADIAEKLGIEPKEAT